MKKLILLALIIFAGAVANQTFAQKDTKVACFKSSMDCEDCEKTLTDYLRFEKGVKDLKVDLATNTIFVEYRKDKNSDAAIAEAIQKKGYKAEKITQKQYQAMMEQKEAENQE